MVNFLVDKFPLGQLSFYLGSFCECPLHFVFLGVFLGGDGGGGGIALLSQCVRLAPVPCAVLDYKWSWQEEPPSLTQSNRLELLLPLNPAKEILTRRLNSGLILPFLTLPESLGLKMNILATTKVLQHPGIALLPSSSPCWMLSQGQRLRCSLDN